MTIPISVFILTIISAAGTGFAAATLIAAGGRADLQVHIIALRDTLHEAYKTILQYHREKGGQAQLLKKIETTIQDTFDDEIF